MLLSILIPSIPERLPTLTRLIQCLDRQLHPEVEVLCYLDNRRRHLGFKRNTLMREAQGKFICHVDDDDMVSEDFIATVLPSLTLDVDLIAYDADASLNGSPPFRVRTLLGAKNEQPQHLPNGRYSDIIRQPWSWCAWRKEIAVQGSFPLDGRGDEDWYWLSQVIPLVRTWHKIDHVFYHHFYDAKKTTFAAS